MLPTVVVSSSLLSFMKIILFLHPFASTSCTSSSILSSPSTSTSVSFSSRNLSERNPFYIYCEEIHIKPASYHGMNKDWVQSWNPIEWTKKSVGAHYFIHPQDYPCILPGWLSHPFLPLCLCFHVNILILWFIWKKLIFVKTYIQSPHNSMGWSRTVYSPGITLNELKNV